MKKTGEKLFFWRVFYFLFLIFLFFFYCPSLAQCCSDRAVNAPGNYPNLEGKLLNDCLETQKPTTNTNHPASVTPVRLSAIFSDSFYVFAVDLAQQNVKAVLDYELLYL